MKRGAALLLLLLAGCAHAPPRTPPVGAAPPAVDSATVALWRMDEPAGTHVYDSGPYHLDGTAGPSVRRPFGRFGGGLGFEPSLDSFVYVPYGPGLSAQDALTVEAWLFPTAFGTYEDTPIAARWTEEGNHQSWIFGIAGLRIQDPSGNPGPGYHRNLFPDATAGKLLFAFQPLYASPPRAYVSSRVLELNRWTHVAVTFDGHVVRFYIDGELDSQFASLGLIRPSEAPVLIGNYFDVRQLTGFGGDLRPETFDSTPYYAYQGRMDELRVSRTARGAFPTLIPR